MRCLIVGGAGFIGSSLAEALLNQGHSVRIFDRRNVDPRNLSRIRARVDLVGGDFYNREDVDASLANIDVVIHLACTTLPKTSNDNIVYDVTTNVAGTVQLLDACTRHKVRRVVFASSGGTVYGIPRQDPISEVHPTDPICSYGITKLACEKYLRLFHHTHGLEYAILRIANPYGERQDPRAGQGAVTTFLWRILRNEPITIWGDGSVARDYVHVEDVARAFVLAIENDASAEVFNVGSGVAHSLNTLLSLIAAATKREIVVHNTPARAVDVPMNRLDVTRAHTQLGWKAAVELGAGILATWDRLRADFDRW